MTSIDGLIRFLKKVSSYENSHEGIVKHQIHDMVIFYISKKNIAEALASTIENAQETGEAAM